MHSWTDNTKRALKTASKVALAGLAALALCLLIIDVVWESHGVPEFVAARVRTQLEQRGLRIHGGHVRLGLLNGLAVEDARIRLSHGDLAADMECELLTARPGLRALCGGVLVLRGARFTGLSVDIVSSRQAGNDGAQPKLSLSRCAGRLRIRESGVLAVVLEGLFEKIAVFLEAEIHGIHTRTAARPVETPTRTPAEADSDPILAQRLQQLDQLLNRLRLAEKDASVSASLAIDLRRPHAWALDGQFGVSDVHAGGLFLRKAKGRFACTHGQVRLHDTVVFLGSDDVLEGELVFNLDAQPETTAILSARIDGRIRPDTLMRAFGVSAMPTWRELRSPSPATLSVTVEAASLDPLDWDVQGTLTGAHAAFHGITVRDLTADTSWRNGVLDLTVKESRVGAAVESTQVSGRMTWDTQAERLSGNVQARLRLPDMAAAFGWRAALPWMKQVDAAAPLTVDATLTPSPLHWQAWRAEARIRGEQWTFREHKLGPADASLTLDNGTLRIDTLALGMPGIPEDAVRLDGHVDLRRCVEEGLLAFAGNVDVQASSVRIDAAPGEETASRRQPALSAQAALTYTLDQGRLALDATGTVFPDRLYRTYQAPLALVRNRTLARIACPDVPARFALAGRRERSAAPLVLQGSIEAEKAVYNDLPLERVRCDVMLRPNRLEFSRIEGVTGNGDDISLDVEVQFRPPRVRLSNGLLRGSPQVVGAFIDNRDARAIYQTVWKEIDWADTTTPRIELASLVYSEPAPGMWHLSMDAALTMRDVWFRDFQARGASANVLLDLPGQVTVRNARVETDRGQMGGRISVTTGHVPKCTFELNHLDGGVEPRQVLRAINPAWDDWLAAFAFSPDSAFSCQGSFYLGRDPRLKLSGAIGSPYLEYRGLHVAGPVLDWTVDGTLIYWNLREGKLFGGNTALTGTYDTDTGQGMIAFRGRKMQLAGLAAYLGQQGTGDRHRGTLSGHCRLQILNHWAGEDTQLTGNGSLSIVDADLWHVPLFNSLGKLLDVTLLSRLTGGRASSLGRISQLDADLTFNGDRIKIPSMTTDGTIISLRGSGEYVWKTDRLHLSLTGEALRRVNVISLVFRPLSWVFAAELTGTSKEYSWNLSTPLQRAFSGDDDGRGKEGDN